jgi:hypothetical protein
MRSAERGGAVQPVQVGDLDVPREGAGMVEERMRTILHVLQHALGRDEYGRQTKNSGEDYRNHFVAGPDDVPTCREAVALGFMVEHASTSMSGGDPWFHVTDMGKAHIGEQSPKPPKLTRGQARYRRWLDISNVADVPFGEWLKGGAT